jgi:CspA family cold shock protein
LNSIQGPHGEEIIRKAAETVAEGRCQLITREPPERTKAFTSALIEAAGKKGHAPAASLRLNGTVKVFSDVQGYGFITTEDGTDIFVHCTGISGGGYRYLVPGEKFVLRLCLARRVPLQLK